MSNDLEYPEQTNRCIRETWNESCYTVKAQLYSSAERDVELRKLSYERATARTDVTKKCKLQVRFYCSTNMVLHLFLPF